MESKSEFERGSSKYRRTQENKGIDELRCALGLEETDLSHLQILHYACKYMLMRSQKKHLLNSDLISKVISRYNSPFKRNWLIQNIFCKDKKAYLNEAGVQTFQRLIGSQVDIVNGLFGFITILRRDGTLMYVSENVKDYLKLSSNDVLVSCEKLHEILEPSDEQKIKNIFETTELQNGRVHEFFCSWHTSKIKRKKHSESKIKLIKMKGCFTENDKLFVAICMPMLNSENRDDSVLINTNFATIACNSALEIIEMCKRSEDLLGYKSVEAQCLSLYSLLNTADLELVHKRHKNLLSSKSKKGKTDQIRILRQNGRYIGCLINMYCSGNSNIICKIQFLSDAEIVQHQACVSTVVALNVELSDAWGCLNTTMGYRETEFVEQKTQSSSISLKRHATAVNDEFNDDIFSSFALSPKLPTESFTPSSNLEEGSNKEQNVSKDDLFEDLFMLSMDVRPNVIDEFFGGLSTFNTEPLAPQYNYDENSILNYDQTDNSTKFYEFDGVNEERDHPSIPNSPFQFDRLEMYETFSSILDLI